MNNNWTMEVFIPNFYIYPKPNIFFECIPINFDFTVYSQFKDLCPKSHKIVYFYQKDLSHKIDTVKQNRRSVDAQADLRLSHDVAHFQINKSYLCRFRRNEFVASNFTVKKNNCWFTIVGVIFCRGFIENKFALTPSICLRNGTMRLFV